MREDFQNLIENEEIPDWYLLEEETKNKYTFDFASTVEKTQTFEKEVIQSKVKIYDTV